MPRQIVYTIVLRLSSILMIGNVSTVLEKTAVITASSQIYSQHFALIAKQFNDPRRAYDIIEQVRGRVAADLLAAGSVLRQGRRQRSGQSLNCDSS